MVITALLSFDAVPENVVCVCIRLLVDCRKENRFHIRHGLGLHQIICALSQHVSSLLGQIKSVLL